MNYIVLKFGGSSLTSRGYHKIVSQINYLKNKYKVIVVLSAIQDTTNNLLCYLGHDRDRVFDLAQKHNTLMNGLNINSEEVDNIIDSLKQLDIENINLEQKINTISCGEKLSTMILSKYLSEQKIDHTLLNASEIIYSDSTFDQINEHNYSIKGSFRCDKEYLKKNLCDGDVFILQGYIATTRDSMPCLLSRGGSDTTASLIAAAIDAKRLEIWTDVNGVYSGNPRMIRGTKVINYIGYDLCQELSAMGAKVLHPYCVRPCQAKKIPICIRNTYGDNQDKNNTTISSRCEIDCDEIVAITNQSDITVYDIKSLDMWNNYGFLHDIFGIFSNFHIDINIIITSQFSVRVTTDETNVGKIYNVAKELESKYQVKISRNCSIVSIVGYNISENEKVKKTQDIVKKMGRNNLHIIHYSSNNLTLSYVVNSSIGEELSQKLHDSLITKNMVDNYYEDAWWISCADELISKMGDSDSIYLYNLEEVNKKCNLLRNHLTNISKIYYAMKANNNREVLKTIINNGFGIECVSVNEIEYIRSNFGEEVDIIFTPNYCNTNEYQKAFYYKAIVIIDNIEVILNATEIFSGKEIGLRIDCDIGDGHHQKVITEGENVKFGFPINEVETLLSIVDKFGIKVVGLHSHKGSGILDNYSWRKTAMKINSIAKFFQDLKWVNLGGGFGIKTNKKELDLEEVNKSLDGVFEEGIEIFIEPGRFIVAESGVLLSRVTQVRKKNNTNFIGISTGMNSLIRPTLYNAYHPIVNISKLNQKSYMSYNIVGPICETGDILGENRIMPKTVVNDIILIGNSGAYGKVMSSNYNMRDSASECTIYFGL